MLEVVEHAEHEEHEEFENIEHNFTDDELAQIRRAVELIESPDDAPPAKTPFAQMLQGAKEAIAHAA
jgi:hypothetical protein